MPDLSAYSHATEATAAFRRAADLEAAVGDLLTRWLQTPLTFARWDAQPTGPLREFPSSDQPAQVEQWVPLTRGDFTDPGEATQGERWPPDERPEAP